MATKKKIGLTTYIFIGLAAGVVLGLLLKLLPEGWFRDNFIVSGILKLLGSGFINLIKMVVVPLVFASLASAIASMTELKKLKRISLKTLLFYLGTTAVAVTIAILLGLLFRPGAGINLASLEHSSYTVPESASFVDTLLNMIPQNPIESMASGNLLQIIVFAIFLGLAASLIGEKGRTITHVLVDLNDCILKIVDMIMRTAPFGVGALIATTVFQTGGESLLGVIKMIGVTALAMVLHAVLVYGTLFKGFTRLPFGRFLKAYLPVAGVTFSTSSSNAALPLSMETMEDIGVGKSVYSFTLPLGATINMDGTAIMQGVAAVFVAELYGIPPTVSMLVSVILTAVLASIGTAGAPGVGMIMLAMVLESAGLPLEGIALIIGFDRILDMMRTTLNVMGDCVCSVIVASTENELDRDVYHGSR
ncbi:dicarboxylate/amino acid:cation symporter [Anaerolentibacter hominis]|uniref:dicarboxylate/amino acid:cation symporter n=1 Tax=Anaerolentibacter hominis TaxID=3079009 RepID=UPI0031B831E7